MSGGPRKLGCVQCVNSAWWRLVCPEGVCPGRPFPVNEPPPRMRVYVVRAWNDQRTESMECIWAQSVCFADANPPSIQTPSPLWSPSPITILFCPIGPKSPQSLLPSPQPLFILHLLPFGSLTTAILGCSTTNATLDSATVDCTMGTT